MNRYLKFAAQKNRSFTKRKDFIATSKRCVSLASKMLRNSNSKGLAQRFVARFDIGARRDTEGGRTPRRNPEGNGRRNRRRTHIIDLNEAAKNGSIIALSGKERGIALREKHRLQDRDKNKENIVIRVPDTLCAVAPSFLLGFLSESLRAYGSEAEFFRHYQFPNADPMLLQQIKDGLSLIKHGIMAP